LTQPNPVASFNQHHSTALATPGINADVAPIVNAAYNIGVDLNMILATRRPVTMIKIVL
jgi:hypothetical protein